MPILNGMQTIQVIKDTFNKLNRIHAGSEDPSQDTVVRPMICYLTQYDKSIMKQFICSEEEADLFLEKPMPVTDLVSILKLLHLC